MAKGQVSMEFIILLGFILLLTGPLILVYYTYSSDTEYDISQSQAFSIANKIVDNAESTYYQGEPAKTTIKVRMPKNVKNISVNRNDLTIVLHHKGNDIDVVATSKVNLTGSFGFSEGIKYISIRSLGNEVIIEDGNY